MSDTPQGEGWWVASDGKWYPPESHPAWSGGGIGQPSPMDPDVDKPGLWARFRSWPIVGQIAAWIGVGFVALMVIGAIAGPPEEEAADEDEASAAETTTTTDSPDQTTTTSTTVAPTTTAPSTTTSTTSTTTTTTTAPTPTTPPGPVQIPFDARLELDDEGDRLTGGWDVCQQFVEQRLTSPATAEYPDFYEDDGEVTVWRLPDLDYRYDSQVDSENGFGATLRSFFQCRVDYLGDGQWRLQNLAII